LGDIENEDTRQFHQDSDDFDNEGINKMMNWVLTLIMAASLAGCGLSGANFTATGTARATPLPLDCDITVYTTTPKDGFDELGLVEFTYNFDGRHPDSIVDVKKIARPKVCEAGGNGLLVWAVNGFGEYVKATVVKIAVASVD